MVNYIINIKKACYNFIQDVINFGFTFSFLNFLSNFPNLTGDFYFKILDKRHDCIHDFLVKKYSNIIDYYKHAEIKPGENNKKIWCMWWNGIENAPKLVKICINNFERYSGDYELIILTKDNYSDYVDLPIEIINKVENKIISIVHLSDILRTRLLSLYGGIWVDSTVFICDYVFSEFDNKAYNTVFFEEGKWMEFFTRGRWCGFFMGGTTNMLFLFLYDMLLAYYLDYDILIDYLLIDYVTEIAYNSFSECKGYIDNATLKNSKIFYLEENFSKSCDFSEFLALCEEYKFFKLSYKEKYDEFDENGNITYYGHFLKNND